MDLLQHVLTHDPEIRDEILERAARGSLSAERALGAARDVSATIRRATEGAAVTPGFFGPEEAVVLWEGRPSLLVQDDAYALPPSSVWRQRLASAESILRRSILACGRIELVDHPFNAFTPFMGTGWLVAPDVMVTNRHVAQAFVVSGGDRLVFQTNPDTGRPTEVRLDLKEEHGSTEQREVLVLEPLWIAAPDGADMAFFKIQRSPLLPEPIELGEHDEQELVATIGFPGNDPRVAAAQLATIFDGIHAVKRLAPGQLMPGGDGILLFHDCSTLKGSSGSTVIALDSGKAIGLHFSGVFGERNVAVRATEVRRQMKELEIQPPVVAVRPIRSGVREVGAEAPDGRAGYDPGFLGEPAAVPLPEAAAGTALERDGQAVVLPYTHFSVVMHGRRRLALCAACNVDGSQLRRIPRSGDWRIDGRIGVEEQHDNALYHHNDYDRGHVVRRLSPVWGDVEEASRANDDTFFYTNAVPQHARLNQTFWLGLEDYILDNADIHDLKVSVFTGCVFDPGDPTHRGVQIPRQFWKIVAFLDEGSGALRASGYLMDQAHLIVDVPEEFAFGGFKTYQVSIGRIAAVTGLDLGPLVERDVLAATESFALRPITRLEDVEF